MWSINITITHASYTQYCWKSEDKRYCKLTSTYVGEFVEGCEEFVEYLYELRGCTRGGESREADDVREQDAVTTRRGQMVTLLYNWLIWRVLKLAFFFQKSIFPVFILASGAVRTTPSSCRHIFMWSLIWRWRAFAKKRQIKNNAKLTSYTVWGLIV